MNLKRIASLTAFVSLFFILLTSAVLYIVPQGRVAYWANWKLWGLSKEQWAAIHINVGILFLISLALHTCYNWQSITLYLKDKRRQLKVFTVNFNIALLVTAFFVVGTYTEMSPFSNIIAINAGIKEAAARKYGEPPYGHAELSTLRAFTRHLDIDLEDAIKALAAAGFAVESDSQSLKEVAVANGVAPQAIYLAMLESFTDMQSGERMPQRPRQGAGRLTLEGLCAQYGLNMDLVRKVLAEENIRFREGMNLRQIAELNKLSPIDVYGKIRQVAEDKERR
ncbi:hypothetical protein A7E78_06475 [Syntrophotalea acetylenivorans]|uniref:Flavinylation-associated cytochrome domain-containing protein n=1 Tax=Syntrophotalea acetylenivorans TaxID=1842532 RepID=A0A1L3GNK9_9BACT|nr:DUF4405 domain-containing protein [Syntrophotalea acetylenivorans]APG27517.1 hypothetical protein A7E78_06475 [Syntrophotalea acetylenivorans]